MFTNLTYTPPPSILASISSPCAFLLPKNPSIWSGHVTVLSQGWKNRRAHEQYQQESFNLPQVILMLVSVQRFVT